MKKKITAVLVAAMCAILLCACGSGNNNSENKKDNNDNTVASKYYLTFNKVDIRVGEKLDPIIEKLGKDYTYFEADSCAFQGKDKVYTYGNVVISNYQIDDVDYVGSIELKDDMISTNEGISIGSTHDEVIKAYGDAEEETDSLMVYKSENCTIRLVMKDGKVSYITYSLNV